MRRRYRHRKAIGFAAKDCDGYFLFKAAEKKREFRSAQLTGRHQHFGNMQFEEHCKIKWDGLGVAGQEHYRGMARGMNKASKQPKRNFIRKRQLDQAKAEWFLITGGIECLIAQIVPNGRI